MHKNKIGKHCQRRVRVQIIIHVYNSMVKFCKKFKLRLQNFCPEQFYLTLTILKLLEFNKI